MTEVAGAAASAATGNPLPAIGSIMSGMAGMFGGGSDAPALSTGGQTDMGNVMVDQSRGFGAGGLLVVGGLVLVGSYFLFRKKK